MIYVVVGGGIAGVSCTKRLMDSLHSSDSVVLISASKRVKTVTQWKRIGQFTEQFDVNLEDVVSDDPRFLFIQATVVQWRPESKELLLSNRGTPVKYDRLCIASGAQPIEPFHNEKVLTIRDTDSAEELQRRLKGAKRIAVVGNGGIATEVVFEIKGVSITWIIRDDSISSVFFRPAIAEFFQKRVEIGRQEGAKNAGVLKRLRYATDGPSKSSSEVVPGCALGPDWISALSFEDSVQDRSVDVIRNVEVQEVQDLSDGVRLSLSNGNSVECDFVIWATGVIPCTGVWKAGCEELALSASDGGIVVDDAMRTSVPDVYACGDACSLTWTSPSAYWKQRMCAFKATVQMRLWTQARQMGDYCARSMIASGEIEIDFCFELFTHTTTFFGYKVRFHVLN
ncbi:unnamed protein product [Heligmosomoides polygyrus]|uniref:Pyr_redox_2 domain-containing protein n=1 Tax=Heligmosomoides polygyrus TaxID=6339 RepID=A0A183GM92_HELPZ|nr:unnamed protein product [Heligmosomoides polygyrus]